MSVQVGPLTPSYITVDPATGAVGAAFTGQVHAQGLDLDAPIAPPIPTQHQQIRWSRVADGSLVALAEGVATASGVENDARLAAVGRPGGVGQVAARLQARDDSGVGILAEIQAQFNPSDATQSIVIGLQGVADLTVLDQDRNSGFLQLLAVQKLQLQIGTVNVALPTGNSDNAIPLAQTWPTNHLACYVGVKTVPNGRFSLTPNSWGVNTLASGRWSGGSAGAQTVTFEYISIGN